ncbi:SurA N-terminal domain-containing protein [Shewanella sp. JM162201]|uniref:Periplasmic chaperone PpiD n=1 Tax=Shewanella jiangmenensis TaxID=2837387 RepID=A0ABS5UZX6_9GAMM|nr:SurA N-terminal domain-containing protein [Shewanella jiangmenensis]MBT1443198.1 SurA N-terminal domain-containing protein [Shewanella jiangmenensis]
MLEKIREGSQGTIAKSILVLVILSFAFTGVSSYLGSSTETPAATVNGEVIPESALEQAYQNEKARMEQQLGDMFETLAADDNYLRSIKQGVLERLVADKLLDQTATELGLRVSDEQIKQAILEEPAFQTEGKFDNERYQAILRQLGYQTNSFRDMMRVDMTRRQLINALVGSEFVLPSESKAIAELQGQTRDLRYVVVTSQPFEAGVSVTDEEAKSFYDANPDQFINPEQVSLEYLMLSAKTLADAVNVTEEQAKTYYDEHMNQYKTPEKRLAGHILVNLGEDEAAAKAKIDAIYAKLQGGADFAEVAKTDSEDTFSGEQGGQLDWFEQGVMDPAFDGALFALEKGAYSAPVKSEYGFHIIKLLDQQGGEQAAFADVKDRILAQLKDKEALDKFYSLQQKLADTSYEVPDSLVEAAKATGLELKTTALFARELPPAEISNPALIKAAFSEQVLQSGMNSDVIDLGDNNVAVVRMKEHKLAGTLPFAEVKAGIVTRLTQDKANEAAKKQADELLAKFKAGEAIDLTAKAKVARFDRELDPSIVNKAFQLAVGGADSVSMAAGYAVVVLDKVNAAEKVEDALVEALAQRLSGQYTENTYRGVIESLKAKAEVTYGAE